MKHKFVYSKMNKDFNVNKHSPEVYFDAQNIRIVSNDNGTTGAVTPEKGNVHVVTIPNIYNIASPTGGSQLVTSYEEYAFNTIPIDIIQSLPYTNDELFTLPPQLNPVIVGYANNRDKLIVFTSIDDGDSLIPTADHIWEIDLDNGNIRLIYVNYLGLSKSNYVNRAICRYENSSIIKLYWTDNTSPIRFINIADPNVIDRKLDTIDISPAVDYDKPYVSEFISGGGFKAGVVQWAYSLYSSDGAETKVSPYSSEYGVTDQYKGFELDENAGVSFRVRIDNLDPNFNTIRLYRLFYTSLDQDPDVDLIAEERIVGGSYSFVDDGLVTVAASSKEEVQFLGGERFVCKDIAEKDNLLLAANIKYTNFDVDIDTRMYRFDNTRQSLIKDNNQADIIIDGVTPDWAVPEDYDCINPTNKEEATLNYVSSPVQNPNYMKYVYQADGSTLGAEGRNFKLKIKTNYTKLDNTQSEIELTKIPSQKNRSEDLLNRSYKRDEVYRIGIRFINKFGQRSFVKWMLDLRMPNQNTHPMMVLSGGDRYLADLYFDIDVKDPSAIPDDVVGYEIVRVKRSDDDKTILTQGIINATVNYVQSGVVNKTVPSDYFRTLHDNSNSNTYGFTFEQNKNLSAESVGNNVMNTNYINFFSPDVEKKGSSFTVSSSDYFTIVGGSYVSAEGYYKWTDYNNTTPFVGLAVYRNSAEKLNVGPVTSQVLKAGHIASNDIVSIVPFGTPTYVQTGIDYEGDNTIDIGTFGTKTNYRNTIDYFDGIFRLKGFNNKCLVTAVGLDPTSTGIESHIGSAIPNNSTPKIIVADYKRSRPNQYGGDTYEARTRNQYIPCSDYIDKTNYSFEVRGGDIFVTYWNMLRTQAGDHNTGAFTSSFRDTIIVPLESTYNLNSRIDEENNQKNELIKVQKDFVDYFIYNDVYQLESTIDTTLSKPLNFVTNEEFDARVLASEVKINGEVIDGWSNFPINDYIDLNYSFGGITSLIENFDNIYFFQPDAVGALVINPKVQTVGTDGYSVQLGTGEKLDDYKYLSTNSGCLHQYGAVKTPFGIFYVDTNNYKIKQVGEGVKPISDIGGMHSWLRTNIDITNIKLDSPYEGRGVITGYNHETEDVYFTLLQGDTKKTFAFNNFVDGFTSFYSYTPSVFVNNRNRFISTSPDLTKIYKHNVGDYNVFYDQEVVESSITHIINPQPDITKLFDNLEFNARTFRNGVEVRDPMDSIRIWNDYQDSGVVNIIDGQNIKGRLRTWRMALPRQQGSRTRISSPYIYLTLTYTPELNTELILEDLIVRYEPRPHSFI